MKEIWKDIKGYEGKYQVSNLGRVKSLNYKRTGEEKILKPTKTEKGYLFVCLRRNSKAKSYRVHRLVAEHFIPNTDTNLEVNHKDENKENNCVTNLEWCTHIYNVNYGTRNQRQSETAIKNGINKGEKHGMAKKVICITTGEIFDYVAQVEEVYGIKEPLVSACCTGKRKWTGRHPITGEKLIWMHYDEFLNPTWDTEEDIFLNPFWYKEEEILSIGADIII